MKEIFGNEIHCEDLTNLNKHTIYTKQLIDGMPSKVFSASTFSPYPVVPEVFETRYKKILQVSREKYTASKEIVEQKIYKSIKDLEIEENKVEKSKQQAKQKSKEEKSKEEKKKS
jgi:hypothetical protein